MASVAAAKTGADEAARRPYRDLIDAAKMIHRSRMTDAETAGDILGRFLILHARGEPIGRALEKPFGGKTTPRKSPPKPAKPEPLPPPENLESAKLWCDKLDARGFDTRSLWRVIEEEVMALTSYIAGKCEEEGLEAIEPTTAHRVISRLTTRAIANGAEAKPFQDERGVRLKSGGCLEALKQLYGGHWRDWIRHELVDYLESKRRLAENRIQREVYGDAPALPEDESQEREELAENESQETPSERGDAWEPPKKGKVG